MKRISFLFILLSTALLAQEFKTSKAKEALSTYQAELKKIDALKQKAKEKYKRDLTEALSFAMKANNLEESVLINSILEKDLAEEPKNNEAKSKLKAPIVLVDNHYGLSRKSESANNTYKFDVQTLGKKSILKVYFKNIADRNVSIFMTCNEQSKVNVGEMKADPILGILDITSFVKKKGPYEILLSNTESDSWLYFEKVELIIE